MSADRTLILKIEIDDKGAVVALKQADQAFDKAAGSAQGFSSKVTTSERSLQILKGQADQTTEAKKRLEAQFREAEKSAGALDRQIQKLSTTSEKHTGITEKQTGVTDALTKTIARYASVGALGYAIKSTITWADRLDEMSSATGISTTRLQQLTYAAGQSGTGFETLITKVGFLNDKIGNADVGTAAALRKLGLSFKDLANLSPDQQMIKIAEAIERTGVSSQTLTTVFRDLFGRGGERLIPMFKDLVATMNEAPTASEANIASMAKLNDAWQSLVTQGKVLITEVLGPIVALLTAIDKIAGASGKGLQWAISGGPLGPKPLTPEEQEEKRRNWGPLTEGVGWWGEQFGTPQRPGVTMQGQLPWYQQLATGSYQGLLQGQPFDERAYTERLGKLLTLAQLEAQAKARVAAEKLKKLIEATVPVLAQTIWQPWSGGSEFGNAPPNQWWEATIPASTRSLQNMPMPELPTQSYGYPVQFSNAATNWWAQHRGDVAGLSSTMIGAGLGGGVGGALGAGAGQMGSLLAGWGQQSNPMTGGAWGGIAGGAGIGIGAGMTGYALGSSYGKGKGALGGALGGAAQGAMIGSVVPGIGTAVGAVIGGVAGAIGGWVGGAAKAKKAAQEADADIFNLQTELIKTYGSFENIQTLGKEIGVDLAGAWGDKNVKGLEHFTALADQFTKTLTEQKSIEEQLIALRAQEIPGWQEMQQLAEQYGISINDLGQSFKQLRTTDLAQDILSDFERLIKGGADSASVLRGMSDEISALVQQSIGFGTEIPENMRPMIQSLIDQGLLLDANKTKITDISTLTFGEAVKTDAELLTTAIGDLVSKLDELINKLGGVSEAAGNIPDEVRIGVRYDYDPYAPPLDYETPMQHGGIVRRPTRILAGEAGPEAIIPLSRAGHFGGVTVGDIHIHGDVDTPRRARELADRVASQIQAQLLSGRRRATVEAR